MAAVLVLAVVCGDTVTPPKLTRNAPVADILHPVEVAVFKALRDKSKLTALYNVDSGLRKLLHRNEPLIGGSRLNGCAAALAAAYVVLVRLDFNEQPLRVEVGNHRLSCLVSVHTRVLSADVLADSCIVVHHMDNGQVVALAYFKVVGVVRGGNLNAARAEFHINVIVRNNGDFSVGQRKLQHFADDILVALVGRVYRNGGVAEQCFGAGRCDFEVAASVRKRVVDVPEEAVLLLVLALDVGNRGLAVRAPVDNALAVVNQPLVVEVHKHLLNRL